MIQSGALSSTRCTLSGKDPIVIGSSSDSDPSLATTAAVGECAPFAVPQPRYSVHFPMQSPKTSRSPPQLLQQTLMSGNYMVLGRGKQQQLLVSVPPAPPHHGVHFLIQSQCAALPECSATRAAAMMILSRGKQQQLLVSVPPAPPHHGVHFLIQSQCAALPAAALPTCSADRTANTRASAMTTSGRGESPNTSVAAANPAAIMFLQLQAKLLVKITELRRFMLKKLTSSQSFHSTPPTSPLQRTNYCANSGLLTATDV